MRKTINTKRTLYRRKIIIKQIFKYFEIILGKMIDAAIIRAYFFTSNTKRIFIGYKKKCKIIVPKILIKSIVCSNNLKSL